MSINPGRYEDLSNLFDEIIHSEVGSEEDRQVVIEYCQSSLIDDVFKILIESRAPKLYVFGRSGAGKSSLINALCGREVADVGAFQPTTVSSEAYDVHFPDRNARWEIVDSRGLFESVPADGEIPIETVEKLETDLESHNPDILLHVMTPEQVRAGEDDFAIIEELDDSVIGGLPPRAMCINKVDTFLSLGDDWPPEQNEMLRRQINELLDLVTEILPIYTHEYFSESEPAQGRLYDSKKVLGAFPTYLKEEPYWNLETLAELLCRKLPERAILQFAQSQRRERLMRQLARKQTITIAEAANTVPRKLIIDPRVPIMTGLESYLIALIGSFSGRELSGSTVAEYHSAGEISLQEMALTASGAMTDVLTGPFKEDLGYIRSNFYCVGRSAEAFFFDGEFIDPEQFRTEAKQFFQNS